MSARISQTDAGSVRHVADAASVGFDYYSLSFGPGNFARSATNPLANLIASKRSQTINAANVSGHSLNHSTAIATNTKNRGLTSQE